MRIFIILTDTGTLFTRAIKMYTRKPFNHTSISFNEGQLKNYPFFQNNHYGNSLPSSALLSLDRDELEFI